MPTVWLDVPEWLRDRTFRGVPVVDFLRARCAAAGWDEVILLDGPAPADVAVFRLTEDGDAGAQADTVDDPWELAVAEKSHQERQIADLVRAGVRFADPWRVALDLTVRIAPRATIGTDVVLRGTTTIAAGADVQTGAHLVDTTVDVGAVIKPYSVCEGAIVGPNAVVGPMAHLRGGAVLKADVKVGNFVEVKNTTLHVGAKSSHLTYLGDAEIGADANIGAGTITCNYDGHRKQRTIIGERAFIGSNTALVAPVRVGDDVIIGAGSVITRDVPAGALAVERAPLRVLEGRAGAIHEKNRQAKKSE